MNNNDEENETEDTQHNQNGQSRPLRNRGHNQNNDPPETAPAVGEENNDETTESNELNNMTTDGMVPIGTIVSKRWDGIVYYGKIVSYDPIPRWYQILYDEDNDQEDMTEEEVQACIEGRIGDSANSVTTADDDESSDDGESSDDDESSYDDDDDGDREEMEGMEVPDLIDVPSRSTASRRTDTSLASLPDAADRAAVQPHSLAAGGNQTTGSGIDNDIGRDQQQQPIGRLSSTEEEDEEDEDEDEDEEEEFAAHDVLRGQGNHVNYNPGNIFFANVVREHKEEFKRGSNKQRKEIAKRILDLISARTPPGRFLGKDHVTVLDETAAIKRIRQTFVDMLKKSKKQKKVSGKTDSTTASTMASATEDANTSANIPAAATHGTTAQLSATETTSDGGASLDENKKKNKTTTTTSNTPPTRIDGDDDENMDDDNDNNDDFDPGPDSSGSNDEEEIAPGRGVEECKEEYTSDSDDDENVDDDRPPPPPRPTPRPKSGRNNGGNGDVSILRRPKYPESSEGRNRRYTQEELKGLYKRPCVLFAPDGRKPSSRGTVEFEDEADFWYSGKEEKRFIDESKSEYVSGNKLKLKCYNSDTGLLDIYDHDDVLRLANFPWNGPGSLETVLRILDYIVHNHPTQYGDDEPELVADNDVADDFDLEHGVVMDDDADDGGNNNNAEHTAAVANDSTEGGGGVVGGNNNNAEHTEEESTPVLSIPTSIVVSPLRDQIE